MTESMASLVGNFFEKQNLGKIFGNYKSTEELQEARKAHQAAEAEYRSKFRASLDSDDDLKKDMFLSINKRNSLNKLKEVHFRYRTALKELIAEKKLNDAKQSSAGSNEDAISQKNELVAHFSKINLKLIKNICLKDWVSLIFIRK